MTTRNLTDWRTIEDEKEKYAAYLCSPEWGQKRAAVHQRAGDKCERCKMLPIAAVHHLTYLRRYNEDLEDLQAICQPCHDFTHGKSDFDPNSWSWRGLLRYLMSVRDEGTLPIPLYYLIGCCDLSDDLEECVKAIRILEAADLTYPAVLIAGRMPFDMPSTKIINMIGLAHVNAFHVEHCYRITGLLDADGGESSQFLVATEEGDDD